MIDPWTVTARLALIGALALGAAAAQAQQAATPYTKVVEGSFSDVTFALEQAITNEGLVIDGTHHVGEMLSRTKDDVGGAKELFTQADTFSFCSAVLSRKVMEADIGNVQFCPYSVFVYEAAAEPGRIVVGHLVYPGETMAEVNALLTRIVDGATE